MLPGTALMDDNLPLETPCAEDMVASYEFKIRKHRQRETDKRKASATRTSYKGKQNPNTLISFY